MSAEEPEKYLAVLKACYDYNPQSDDEIAIKEEQLLLLVEKTDEDWWKVKLTGTTHDTEKQIGLVPAAYVEQAQHTSVVKAIYDYDAAAPGELTVHEDDILLLFDNEEDWILVQESRNAGNAGYVPGNYVEVVDEEESKSSTSHSAPIIVPASPTRPPYTDPAEKVASTKVTADNIKTWSVSEIDKNGKKKKGTLGIGGGSLFFASESDKTPVQKWQTKDVIAASSEKAKHVQINIGGSKSTNLHFHTGSKENADAILEKLQPPFIPEAENAIESTSSSPPKKPSVHFSPAAPTIIPDADDEEFQKDNEIYEMATVLYDFHADGHDELTVNEGDQLTILLRDGDDWWKCRNAHGVEGVVPASYLEIIGETVNPIGGSENGRLSEENRRHDVKPVQSDGGGKHQVDTSTIVTKAEVEIKAKETSPIAQLDPPRKVVGASLTASPPPVQVNQSDSPRPSLANRMSSDINRPSSNQTRIWHDRSGQFRVEAAFLGFNNGKLRLHKVNGVIVEVPSEKMSLDDMRYVEKVMEKKRSSNSNRVSDDDVPLAIAKNTNKASLPSKRAQIDWFDFFLSAGCDLDDCTRYAASFERDKMDETLLNDITEGTMRSLGLREGDIIRVKKIIEKRKPTDHLQKPTPHLQEQIQRDEELARHLQAQENAIAGRSSAPNLFSGPGGVLKAPRRGRPQPSKSLPPTNVDLNAISSASGQIQYTTSPPSAGAQGAPSSLPPPRPNSVPVPAVVSGFEDEAWTNRPSSTKPSKPASPAAGRIPDIADTASPPKPAPPPSAAVQNKGGSSVLTKTTEADIFDQLARLSDLKKNPAPQQPQQTIQTRPAGFQSEMGPSLPMATQVADSRMLPPASQPFHGARGPFAPVPANHSLLQPLIPTQTGFNGFVPTKAAPSPLNFQNHVASPSFIQLQPTFQSPLPMTQPNGYFGPMSAHNESLVTMATLPVQPQPQSFHSRMNPSAFTLSPQPSNAVKDTSPASVFAQMKSGTFANDNARLGSLNRETRLSRY